MYLDLQIQTLKKVHREISEKGKIDDSCQRISQFEIQGSSLEFSHPNRFVSSGLVI